MRILFCGSGWLTIVDRVRARLPAGSSIAVRDPAAPLESQVAGYQVLLPSNGAITRDVLAAASDVRLIQQPAAGYEGIDLEAARARDIPVCNAPGQNVASVAEAALALMLALARRFPEARAAFQARTVGEPLGTELTGKGLGIVGMGRSGSALAAVARALGMTVRGTTSRSTPADLEALLSESDFISIHCPLTERTRGLIGVEALQRVKPGAFLVNCARGAIVDRDALVGALESGRLGGAGLDVHWEEPPDPADPLYGRADVVALPHIAGSTNEAFDRLVSVVLDNLDRLKRGAPLLHRVA